MKLVCAPEDHAFDQTPGVLEVVLYGHGESSERGSAGAAIAHDIARRKLCPSGRAWDFLSLALAVTAADLAGHRTKSPDGWTRDFELEVAVADPDFWNAQRSVVNRLPCFLTTDRWQVGFVQGGVHPVPPKQPVLPQADCVALLSGGLDSFIGNLDLAAAGTKAFAVSQLVRGDAANQRSFAGMIGGGLEHLQINHTTVVPDPESPPSQRARSLVFTAYGVLAATSLKRYQAGEDVTLFVCENGFVSINPPLTDGRLGSLSTRTTHPVFLRFLQHLLDSADLRVRLHNPYQLKTKGEMLRDCADQILLRDHATETTSCSRFLQHGYKHCGRCVPCLVRRAAFRSASLTDATEYVYADIGRDDDRYAAFDDVRSVAMALVQVEEAGLEAWLGTALSTALLGDVTPLQNVITRGLAELESLFTHYGVK